MVVARDGSSEYVADIRISPAAVDSLSYLCFHPAVIHRHQGEENADDAVDYKCFQKQMLLDWRKTFNLPSLPYIFVLLQPCGIPPVLHYAQATTLSLPATGMAACYDLADPDPTNLNCLCHSRYKQECGRRLVLEVQRVLKKQKKDWSVSAQLVPDRSSRSKFSIQLNSSHLMYQSMLQSTSALNRWNGTKQCTQCCGTAKVENTQGVMRILVSSGSWKYA